MQVLQFAIAIGLCIGLASCKQRLYTENSCSEDVHGGVRKGGVLRSFLPRHWKACSDGDAGEPLFLTPFLRNGSIEQAVALSKVSILGTSYSGYLTVNAEYKSNMFFWFFPAQQDPENAPVLLWLQGGPGGSSMFGLFVEFGPLRATASGSIVERQVTWNKKYSLLFIDNPVGTGFSFTGSEDGYARNEEDVARDLYIALTQFFSIYKTYQKNDFYVTGESYAGKYVPSISQRILVGNAEGTHTHINFRGMAIGDGLTDPLSMNPHYAELMHQTSLIDSRQADYVKNFTKNMTIAISEGQFLSAFHMFDDLLNGDLIPYPSWYYNVTGTTNYFNILYSAALPDFGYFMTALADNKIRESIHVGNLPFHTGNTVEEHLLNDVQNTSLPAFLDVLMADDHKYKVLVYNGQLDIIVGVPLTEGMLSVMEWTGKAEFAKAERKVWRINPSDTEVAGYSKKALNLQQVTVRGAGHMVPFDQPGRALDMITRFVDDNMP